MREVNIHEAKSTLSRLVEAAVSGERVVLARAGKPVAEIVRIRTKPRIKLNVLKGKLPVKLLNEAVKPLSKIQIARLFGTLIEP